MAFLISDDAREHFRIEFRGPAELTISVPVEVYQALCQELINANWVVVRSQCHVGEPFIPPDQHEFWGFGGVFQAIVSEKPGWYAWRCLLPVGIPERSRFERARPVFLSLTVLFRWLRYYDAGPAVAGTRKQAFNFGLDVDPSNADDCSIDGTLSPVMMRWVGQRYSGRPVPLHHSVKEAMCDAYNAMLGSKREAIDQFQAEINASGLLWLSCPGNGVNFFSEKQDNVAEGATFTARNVDTYIHALTFVAGLAALDELLRDPAEGF